MDAKMNQTESNIPEYAGSYSFKRVDRKQIERWLAEGKNIRKINPNKVKKLARAIDKFGWRHNGNPIRFYKGVLDDGQHRLSALLETTKKTQAPEFLVWVFDAGCDADTVDTGDKRTGAQLLGAKYNVKNANLTCATLKLLRAYASNSLREPGDAVWGEEASKMLDVRPTLMESISFISSKLPPGQPSMFAALHFIASNKGKRDEVESFIKDVLDETCRVDSPAGALRAWFKEPVIGSSNRQKDARFRAAIIKAWNLWNSGARKAGVATITWDAEGGEAYPSPKF